MSRKISLEDLAEAYYKLKDYNPHNFLLSLAAFNEEGQLVFTPLFKIIYSKVDVDLREVYYLKDLQLQTQPRTDKYASKTSKIDWSGENKDFGVDDLSPIAYQYITP